MHIIHEGGNPGFVNVAQIWLRYMSSAKGPKTKVPSMIKGTTSSNCLFWAIEDKTNHSLGTIQQQNGCEWLGNNVVMVIPLIILELMGQ